MPSDGERAWEGRQRSEGEKGEKGETGETGEGHKRARAKRARAHKGKGQRAKGDNRGQSPENRRALSPLDWPRASTGLNVCTTDGHEGGGRRA
jgi:hypothetical protein